MTRFLLVALAVAAPATAGTLRGTIFFPQEQKAPDRPLANWRVENGVLPIVPSPPESRADAVVVLEAEKPPASLEPTKIQLEARALRLEPKVLVATVGSTLEIKNGDRLARTLYLADGESYMPREATAPGQQRVVKFGAAGEFKLRDADYPHAGATLLVVPSPWFGHADDKGSFKIEAPDGKYTLKVYFRGVWAASQPVEVGHGGEVLVRLTLPEGK